MATLGGASTTTRPIVFGTLTARNFKNNTHIGTTDAGVGFLRNLGDIQLVSQVKDDEVAPGEIKRTDGFEANF